MITYDEALNIAKEEYSKINRCAEYTNYYRFYFYYPLEEIESEEEMNAVLKENPELLSAGGPGNSVILSKKDGEQKYGTYPIEHMFPGEKLIRDFEIK